MWEELRLPVDIAFFFRVAAADRVQAFYPGPMGATESLLVLEAWDALEAANPVLATLAATSRRCSSTVRAGAGVHWIAPIDECFSLVGLIRTHWRG